MNPPRLGTARLVVGIAAVAALLTACAGSIDAGDDPGGPGAEGTGAASTPRAPRPGDPAPAGGGDFGLPRASSTPSVPGPGVPGAAPTFRPAEPRWQRLTAEQLRNTLVDLFGSGIAAADLEPDVFEEGFANIAAARLSTSAQGIERLGDLAFRVAAQVMGDPARRGRWVKCAPSAGAVRACAEETFRRLGRAVFRHPVAPETLRGLVAIAERAALETGDPAKSLEYGLAAMLQSPRFLYLLELPEAELPAGEVGRVSPFTLASRLAFFLWGSTPDEALLDAAASGELGTPAGVRRQVDRLLAAPRARGSLRTFFTSLWSLGPLRGRSFDRTAFPKIPATLGESALEETMRFLEHHLIAAGRDFAETFVSPVTFVNRDLAPLYKVAVPPGDAFVEVTLPAGSQRHGLLTQVSMLAASSSPTETNPMLRGRAVREDLLCQKVPDPPPDLMATLPAAPGGRPMTKRQRLDIHRTDPGCASCHRLIDPIGVALEHYDAVGAHRTTENGLPIDASGELDGVAFADARGLVAAVKAHKDLGPCLVRKLFRYATAHVETEGERPLVDGLGRAFDESGRRWGPLVTALATSDGLARMTMLRR